MSDVLDRLRKWCGYNVGDPLPNDWSAKLQSDLGAAIAEIEHLRSIAGPIHTDPSFATIRQDMLTTKAVTTAVSLQIDGTWREVTPA